MKLRVVLAVLLFSFRATAEEPPRIDVRVQGGGAVLQERRPGDVEWRRVCESPCDDVVTPDPWAEHRIVANARIHPITIWGNAGDRVAIRLDAGSKDARTPLFAAGGALFVVGALIGRTKLDVTREQRFEGIVARRAVFTF